MRRTTGAQFDARIPKVIIGIGVQAKADKVRNLSSAKRECNNGPKPMNADKKHDEAALAAWESEGGAIAKDAPLNGNEPLQEAPGLQSEQARLLNATVNSLPGYATSLQQRASLCPAIAELERAFEEFCFLPFKRKMPRPVITLHTRGRSRAIGWFWKDKWQNGQPKKLPEINIVAEYLGQNVEDIAEVVLHEMVHFSNYLDGIEDCSSSQYHNRRFRDRCHLIGLTCEKLGRRGWAYTKLSNALRDIVRMVRLSPEAFQMYRVGPQYTVVETKPEQRQRRWTCQCKKPAGKVIYASRGLDVTCNNCLKVYEEHPR